jgi:hypothetical protein
MTNVNFSIIFSDFEPIKLEQSVQQLEYFEMVFDSVTNSKKINKEIFEKYQKKGKGKRKRLEILHKSNNKIVKNSKKSKQSQISKTSQKKT